MLEAAAVVTRFAQYIVLLGLFGAAASYVYAGRTALPPSRRGFVTAAVVGLGLTTLALAVLGAQMMGTMAAAMDPATHWAMLSGMAAGMAWWARAAALLAIALLFTLAPERKATVAWTTILSAVAVASLAFNGHGAGGEGTAGWVRLTSTSAHLLAAGAWFGALVLFLTDLLRWRSRDIVRLHAGLAGFAGIGSICVAVLVGTGLLNAVLLVGFHPGVLFAIFWGRLLLLKLGLFGVMLLLAAHNRFTLTPALSGVLARETGRSEALARLRLSLIIETFAAVAVVALVAWLGTLSPVP